MAKCLVIYKTTERKLNTNMRHNKKRNTALLYEFLIRHVSKCLIESRKAEANKAVGLLKKYYKSGPLREELDLFDSALQSKVQTAEYASKVLSEQRRSVIADLMKARQS